MSGSSRSPIFLERASYRQRRLRDAARLLPFLGLVLWAIPLLWSGETGEAPSSASAVVYIFGIWVLLIALTAAVASFLRSDDAPGNESDTG